MAFRGCFVGLDRYASHLVTPLGSAVRDAEALHALFSDNLGPSAEILLNSEATTDAIRETLRGLQTSTEDDIVIVAFSGHGTSTHQLVTFDTELSNLAGSSISLDELTHMLGLIPARQLICILDCCFAGGAGAKVLTSPRIPRALDEFSSATAKLEAMAGAGRLILTAAAADEPAWEDGRLGHGLLTYALLEALKGAESVRRGNRVPIYALLHYVVEQVRTGAATHGACQTATLRGQMDGEVTWPVFTPGALYRSRFPEYAAIPVTSELDTLQSYGFAPELLATLRLHIPTLNQLQQDAINDYGLLTGSHLLVSAPTSSGKTLLGELVALKAAQQRRRSVFLLPTRALVNDKYDQFTSTYGSLGVRVLRATGESSDDVPALMRGEFEIALLTYEKFVGLILLAPYLLRQLALVVVDEVQTIADLTRGANLEFLLTLIRSRRSVGIEPQLVLLSAVLGSIDGFDTWLGARYLRREHRPVPLQEGVIRPSGIWRYLDVDGQELTDELFLPEPGRGTGRDIIIPLVRHLTASGKRVIVFRNQRARTRICARYLASSLGLAPATDVIETLPVGDPSGASAELRIVLAGGIAFHNAELSRDEKRALEKGFRNVQSNLRVLVATTTLAQGINTPAEAVIVAELDHPIGGKRTVPYSVAEYKNIIGRAGRLGFSERGQAFLLVNGALSEEQRWRRYITGTPEDLVSSLFSSDIDILTLVLRVIGTASGTITDGARGGMTAREIIQFLALSFAAHQSAHSGRQVLTAPEVERTVAELLRTGLIVPGSGGQLLLTDLGFLAGAGMATARTVLLLADFIGRLPAVEVNRASLICAAQITEEVSEVRMPINAKGWQKELATYGAVLIQQKSGIALDSLRQTDRTTAATRVKRAVACLLWMDGVPRSQLDTILTRHMPDKDAAGHAQAVAARSRDVIEVVLEVAQLRHPTTDFEHLRTTLPVQLELGIPRAISGLGRHLGQRLTRSNYLRLITAGYSTSDAIRIASDGELLACLDNDRIRLDLVRNAIPEPDGVDQTDITALLESPT